MQKLVNVDPGQRKSELRITTDFWIGGASVVQADPFQKAQKSACVD